MARKKKVNKLAGNIEVLKELDKVDQPSDGSPSQGAELSAEKQAPAPCSQCSNDFHQVFHDGEIDDGTEILVEGKLQRAVYHKFEQESTKAKATWDFLSNEEKLPFFIPAEGPMKGEFRYYSFTFNGIGISIAKNEYVSIAKSLALHLRECFSQSAKIPYNLKISKSEHGSKLARLDLQDEASRSHLNA